MALCQLVVHSLEDFLTGQCLFTFQGDFVEQLIHGRACDGVEYVWPGMELTGSGSKRWVVIPASQGFGENIADFGDDDVIYSASIGGSRGTAFCSDLEPSCLDSSIPSTRSLASSPESGCVPGRRPQRRWLLIDYTCMAALAPPILWALV
jgi:hypothetical protein